MNDKILKELKIQTKWLRFLALPNIKKIIEENITTREQIEIYKLSDGKNSTNDIAKKISLVGLKVSHMTVYNYWRRWFALGIVTHSEKYQGRFEKIIDLEDLNIK